MVRRETPDPRSPAARLVAGPVAAHLVLAAAMWSVAGIGLLRVGIGWILDAVPASPGWWVAAAVALGILKALLVLRRVAARTAARIVARGDGRCLGGFLSPGSWLLVAGMILLGRIVRATLGETALVGAVYAAVGTALAIGSWWLWRVVARTLSERRS